MANLSKWSTTDGDNDQAASSGMPEGMARSLVNDRGREHMGAIRRWYENSEWVDLLGETGGDFTLLRTGTTTFRVTDAEGANATDKFTVGSWVKVTGTGTVPTTVIGRIASVSAYSGVPGQINVTLEQIVNPNDWATAPLPDATVTLVQCYFARTIDEAAFHPTGATLAQSPGEIPTIDDLSTVATKTEGAGGTIDADLLDNQHGAYYEAISRESRGNDIINGDFAVWQRGTSFAAADDTTYCADHVIVLSEAAINDVDVSRQSGGGGQGSRYFLRLTSTASGSTNKFGIGGILESTEAFKYAGGVASFSFRAKSQNAIGAIRAVLLESVSPAVVDAPARDLVGTWGAAPALVTGGTNWSVIGNATYTLSTIWQSFSLPNVSVTSGALNLGWLVYVDDKSHSTGDQLDLGLFQLEPQAVASDFYHVPFSQQLANCQRYYAKTFAYDTTPGDNVSRIGARVAHQQANDLWISWELPAVMRAVPTVVEYNPGSTAAGSADRIDGTPGAAAINSDATLTSDSTVVSGQVSAGGVNDAHYAQQFTASAEF